MGVRARWLEQYKKRTVPLVPVRLVARKQMGQWGGKKPKVKGAIRARKELKYVDTAAAAYAADTTGTVTALNLTAVGDDNTSRDGRQATMKSVQLHGILGPVDITTVQSKCRLLLVWDNAVNSGTIATVAQILTSANATSFPLVDNANRFTILVDRTYAVGGLDTTATQTYAMSPSVHDVEVYKRLDVVTQYSGTTAAIGSIQNGALLMVTIGTAAPAAGGSFNLAARVRFTDD